MPWKPGVELVLFCKFVGFFTGNSEEVTTSWGLGDHEYEHDHQEPTRKPNGIALNSHGSWPEMITSLKFLMRKKEEAKVEYFFFFFFSFCWSLVSNAKFGGLVFFYMQFRRAVWERKCQNFYNWLCRMAYLTNSYIEICKYIIFELPKLPKFFFLQYFIISIFIHQPDIIEYDLYYMFLVIFIAKSEVYVWITREDKWPKRSSLSSKQGCNLHTTVCEGAV